MIIAEKSTARANIIAAVGDRYGPVYAASGHLYQLAPPEQQGEGFTDWSSFATIRPETWLKIPTAHPDQKEQARLDRLRSDLANALKRADRVFIATDADREGELIGREILDFVGFRGQAYRVLFASEDPATLQEAFAKPIPVTEREAIYQSALARERADYIWNLSLTRAATTALVPKGNRGVIGIGRVKSPTQAIVCRRELQIAGFKPDSRFSIRLTLETPAGSVTLTPPKEVSYDSQAAASAAASEILALGTAELVATSKTARKAPPKPPDLVTLQATAGKWGWSADKTLAEGQELYSTAQVMTYVRAATRYYPDAAVSQVPEILAGLAAIEELAGVIPAEPVIRQGKAGFFSDAGLAGESHHALMPNAKTASGFAAKVAALQADQRRLFDLMARLFIQCVSPDEQAIEHRFAADLAGIGFAATGRQVTDPGWTAVRKGQEEKDAGEEDAATAFPTTGTYRIAGAEAYQRKSSPPARYTQGSLIEAMAAAWRFVTEPAQRERLKEAKGIGTVATRGDVIRGLIDQGMIEDKKTLSATKSGLQLFVTLHGIDPRLVDPGTTADWENQIDAIARGELAEAAFVDSITTETERLIAALKACQPNPLFGELEPPTAKMAAAVEAIAKTGIKPPAGWKVSSEITRTFLDQHARKKS